MKHFLCTLAQEEYCKGECSMYHKTHVTVSAPVSAVARVKKLGLGWRTPRQPLPLYSRPTSVQHAALY